MSQTQAKSELERRNQVYVARISIGLLAGIVSAIVAVIAGYLILAQTNPQLSNWEETLAFHEEYSDWKDPENVKTPETFDKYFWNGAFGFYFTVDALFRGNLNSVTGIIRTISVVTVTIAVGLSYRYKLPAQLEIDARKAQLFDFQQSANKKFEGKRFISTLCYIVATLLGSYVMVSVLLFLLSSAFRNAGLNLPSALIVIGLSCGVFTGVASFGASAMDAREIALLGLATLLVGLLLSFSLNDRVVSETGEHVYWWQIAVSAAGRFRPASPIFTSAFTSVFLSMVAVWFDLDLLLPVFVRKIWEDRKDCFLVKVFNRIARVLYTPFATVFRWEKPENQEAAYLSFASAIMLFVVGFLYAATAILLLLVGLVPMDAPNGLGNVHDAGAWGATFMIVILTIIIPKKPYFQPHYQAFSIAYLVILAVAYYFHSIQALSLTGMEILGLALIIVWIYTTLDGILFYMNDNWDTLQPIVPQIKKY